MTPFRFNDMLHGYSFGKTVSAALSLREILAEVDDIARFAAHTLPTLLYTGNYPQQSSNVVPNTKIVRERFTTIAMRLHGYAVQDRFELPEAIGQMEDDVLDFRAFIGLGVIAVEYYGADSYWALSHLLAVVLTRYKIETILCEPYDEELELSKGNTNHCLGHHELAPLMPEEKSHLSIDEIALASGLKQSSVKNALANRNEKLKKDTSGMVPAREAIRWLSTKQGFCWSATCLLIDDSLFLSGALANSWLEHNTPFEIYYRDPQHIVTSWQVPRSHLCVLVNANGKRKCTLILPFAPDQEILSLGLSEKKDLSDESTSHFYNRGFPGGRPAKLFRVTVPSLKVLKKVVDHLMTRSLSVI
ncbi:hypothetical protein K1Y77_01890 [Halomonas qaidamensis]|uniref:WW domain-containing protein n=1 Tax=Halomonas qaidamensis TaxID=2866211 RepID=A0ABY6JQ83_9GAMM|nr:hypothetical protein [Halomonas qaidamensis]UYV19454.1 hypothetical protein K1Y77_01890 [Halomonas qaidamensis]